MDTTTEARVDSAVATIRRARGSIRAAQRELDVLLDSGRLDDDEWAIVHDAQHELDAPREALGDTLKRLDGSA